jgi:hypothetical protein
VCVCVRVCACVRACVRACVDCAFLRIANLEGGGDAGGAEIIVYYVRIAEFMK